MQQPSALTLPRMLADFETRSPLDIRKVGAVRYCEHEQTEILCLGYKLPGRDRQLWVPPAPFPDDIVAHVVAGYPVESHHVLMELSAWFHKLHRARGIPMPRKWIDTQASCAYRALPLGLDQVGQVLDLETKKDKRGKYLIQRLCKPRKPRKAERELFALEGLSEADYPTLYHEDPDLRDELHAYCLDDVGAENDLGDTVGDLPAPEYRLWVLDQTINWRGVQVDMDAVFAAQDIIDQLTATMGAELAEITAGAVTTANQRDKILAWLRGRNIWISDLQAETVKALLDEAELPDDCRRVLEIRTQLGRSSNKKLLKFIETVCADGRVRGLLQYHGASTGRWAGRGVQPQNFPRGSLEFYCDLLGMKDDPSSVMELLIDTIKLRDPEALALLFGDAVEAISTGLRGMFVSAEGKRLLVADFAAIEAVVLAWVAGEDWKVAAFEGIQHGEGYQGAADIYCATASAVFGTPVVDKKTHPAERQVGKVCELAFGYQGGLGAWRNFDSSDRHSDEDVEEFKRSWRQRHPNIVRFWYGLQEAAQAAVRHPGKPYFYGPITYVTVDDKAGHWLTCILPNGRRLWYFNPSLHEWYDHKWKKDRVTLRYEGKDSKRGGAWGTISSYGGMLTENVVQAIARDLMVEAMIRVEKAGYPVVLTVHDEIVAEVPDGFGALDEFQRLLTVIPPWAIGCPIAADGWEATRYRK